MHITAEMIGRMDTNALYTLNNLVVGTIRQRQAEETFAKARSFAIGSKVGFRNKYGQLIKARVNRINTKTVGVTEIDATGRTTGREWRVSPNLLTQIVGD